MFNSAIWTRPAHPVEPAPSSCTPRTRQNNRPAKFNHVYASSRLANRTIADRRTPTLGIETYRHRRNDKRLDLAKRMGATNFISTNKDLAHCRRGQANHGGHWPLRFQCTGMGKAGVRVEFTKRRRRFAKSASSWTAAKRHQHHYDLCNLSFLPWLLGLYAAGLSATFAFQARCRYGLPVRADYPQIPLSQITKHWKQRP